MSSPAIRVIIPTCGRQELLRRTLDSVLAARRPASLESIIVIENGRKSGAEDVVTTFAERYPVEYLFSPKPNKSEALNFAVQRFAQVHDLIVFFDDDVRLSNDTLIVYAREAEEQTRGAFFVGATGVDYEVEPLEWVKPMLPLSATGWMPSREKICLTTSDGLGFNWAGYASDLIGMGGFDPRYGPGSGVRGQETNMYQRLLAAGVASVFLPDAMVYHYVPRERCSPQWVLQRYRELGGKQGLDRSSDPSRQLIFLAQTVRSLLAAATYSVFNALGRRRQEAFRWRSWLWYYFGSLTTFLRGAFHFRIISRAPLKNN
jgi:glycosyltransferase involved in cell wall biosynthesis